MKYPNPLNVTLRSLKTFNGLEGQGFSAVMYVDGKPTADVIDDANGGMCNVQPVFYMKDKKLDDAARKRLKQAEDFIATLPEVPWPASFGSDPKMGTGYKLDIDGYLSEIVSDMQNEKKMARLRKTNLLVRADIDGEDFRTVKSLDTAKVTALCDKQFGAGKWKFI